MSKREIDSYSYQLGVIDCFNEMVNAGVQANCHEPSMPDGRGA